MKLSLKQYEVFAKAREHGGELVRMPGGYWTYKGAKMVEDSPGNYVPEWLCQTNTIFALVRRRRMLLLTKDRCCVNLRYVSDLCPE